MLPHGDREPPQGRAGEGLVRSRSTEDSGRGTGIGSRRWSLEPALRNPLTFRRIADHPEGALWSRCPTAEQVS